MSETEMMQGLCGTTARQDFSTAVNPEDAGFGFIHTEGGPMILPKSSNKFEKVITGEWIYGSISKIEYDLKHKFTFQGKEKVAPGVRFVLKLQGYEYPHKSRWMTFAAHEKSNLYKEFISKLVENVKPSDTFDLDLLVGMDVKTIWVNNGDFQNIDLIAPIGKKLWVPVENGDSIAETETEEGKH